MSAREAFEELGYAVIRDDRHFLKYEKVSNDISFVIVFDKYDQAYTNYCRRFSRFFIDIELNKAIQLQIKEFKWTINN